MSPEILHPSLDTTFPPTSMNLAICPQYCSFSDMQKCSYVWCTPAVYAENLVKITTVVSRLMKYQGEFAFKPGV
jgi:hypothetical protein